MSAFKFTKGMAQAQIVEAIRSIQGRGQKLDNDIQLTGLSILAHIQQHREVSLFNKLYQAMPAGSRRNALAKWALELGQVSVNMDKATAKERPFIFDKEKETKLDKAEQYPWYNFKPEAAPAEAFSFDKWLADAHKMLQAKQKAGSLDMTDRRVQILLGLTPNAVPEKLISEQDKAEELADKVANAA